MIILVFSDQTKSFFLEGNPKQGNFLVALEKYRQRKIGLNDLADLIKRCDWVVCNVSSTKGVFIKNFLSFSKKTRIVLGMEWLLNA